MTVYAVCFDRNYDAIEVDRLFFKKEDAEKYVLETLKLQIDNYCFVESYDVI